MNSDSVRQYWFVVVYSDLIVMCNYVIHEIIVDLRLLLCFNLMLSTRTLEINLCLFDNFLLCLLRNSNTIF